MLRTLPENQKARWHEKLNKLMFAYNASRHSATGYAPYYLLFGREPIILPVDFCLKNLPQDRMRVKQYSKFVNQYEDQMTEAYKIAKECSARMKKTSEEQWRKRLIANELLPGDKILVRNKEKAIGPTKIRAIWEQTIYQVVKKHGNGVTYDVKPMVGNAKQRTLHRNMLLPCEIMEDLPVEVAPTEPREPTRRLRSNASQTQEDNTVDMSEDSDDESIDMDFNLQSAKVPLMQEPSIPTSVTEEQTENPTAVKEFFQVESPDAEKEVTVLEPEVEAAPEPTTVTPECTLAVENEEYAVPEPEIIETPTESVTTVPEAPETPETSEVLLQRRSRKPAKNFVYYNLGGDPVLINVIETEDTGWWAKFKWTTIKVFERLHDYVDMIE